MEVFGAQQVCGEHFLKTVSKKASFCSPHPVKQPHASFRRKNTNGEITDISKEEIKVLA